MLEAFKVLKTEFVGVGGCFMLEASMLLGTREKKVKTYKTTGSNSSGDKDGATAVTEHLEGLLTLTLSAITVDGGGGETLVDEEVGERVGHALGLDEDQGETGAVCVENVKENGALVNILDVLNLLSDVLGCGTDTTDRKEDVLLQEVASKHLDVAGEGGREHERLAVSDLGHVLSLDNAANLRLETHVQHAISLVENKVADVLKGDATTLDQVDKTTGGGNEKIAATLDLAKLGANVGTTVDNTRANPRTVGKLAGLVEDLRHQLTGRSQDQRGGVGLALTAVTASLRGGGSNRAVLESLGKDGEQETTSLSGTGLGTGHQITAAHDDRNRVLLDRSRDLVSGELDVAQQMVVKRRVGEAGDGLGDTLARGLDRDVVILLEVDTSLLLRRVVGDAVKLTLNTGVGGAGNMLAVLPLTVTRAASRAVATRAVSATGSEVGSICVCPVTAATVHVTTAVTATIVC
jgi:hypothetical protein